MEKKILDVLHIQGGFKSPLYRQISTLQAFITEI